MKRRRFFKTGLAAALAPGTASAALARAADVRTPDDAAEAAQSVLEPQRRLPVLAETDVAVVGGGIAGVAAAVAAARLGVKVCLFEKESLPGGLATLGNVVVYLPLCDGYGAQVSGGLSEELLRLSVRQRPNAIPACWQKDADTAERAGKRFRAEFNAWDCALDLEALLLKEGVELWYDTRFCDVIRGDRGIDCLVLENKSGRFAVRTRTVVDASGDADVCARVGAPTVSLNTNVRAGWFFAFDGKRILRVALSKAFTQDGSKSARDPLAYDGTDGRQVTQQLLDTRQMQRERLQTLRQKNPAVEPVNLNTLPDFRMTRRLRGKVEIRAEDMGRWFEDTVGLFANWRKKGPVYPVPFRSLYAPEVANLITAGRCISSVGAAWDQARAIPACAVTGESAGAAAGMLVKAKATAFAALPVDQLQAALRRQGVILDPELAKRAGERAAAVDRTADPKAH